MLRASPNMAAGSVVAKKVINDTLPLELAAINAFCGLPKNVAALPMFAEVAIPSSSSRSSF